MKNQDLDRLFDKARAGDGVALDRIGIYVSKVRFFLENAAENLDEDATESYSLPDVVNVNLDDALSGLLQPAEEIKEEAIDRLWKRIEIKFTQDDGNGKEAIKRLKSHIKALRKVAADLAEKGTDESLRERAHDVLGHRSGKNGVKSHNNNQKILNLIARARTGDMAALEELENHIYYTIWLCREIVSSLPVRNDCDSLSPALQELYDDIDNETA